MGKPLWAHPFLHGHVQEELSISRKRNNISYCTICLQSQIIYRQKKKGPKTKEKSYLNSKDSIIHNLQELLLVWEATAEASPHEQTVDIESGSSSGDDVQRKGRAWR